MFKKAFSLTLLGVGVFVLVQIIMPIVSFKFWELTSYNQNIALVNPLDTQVLGVSVENIDNFPAIVSSNKRKTVAEYSEFYLSIPAIKLDKIKVVVDSNLFENNLAHLPGAALPGEKGNVFITGHSSFPQFYRSGNFKAIFAHLPEVKKGDLIIIEANGQIFKYKVTGLKIVSPEETSVVNPPSDDGRFLSLMTCVPPGFYIKRLIVLSELQ